MNIRPAITTDIALLQAIGKQTFYENFADTNTPEDMKQYLTTSFATSKVQHELTNPDSIFYTYQKLVQIRKENSWLIRADFELLDTADKVFAYIRKDGDRRFLVVANLSNEEQDLTVEGNVKSVLIENTTAQEAFEKQVLAPWDAFCVELL